MAGICSITRLRRESLPALLMVASDRLAAGSRDAAELLDS